MSLSTASILLLLLHACSLLAAARVSAPASTDPVEHGDVNTAMLTNGSATPSSPDDSKNNFEMYFCFLCSGRDPLLIHHCPIYWDECHLICDDDMSTAIPTPPAVAVSSSSSRPVPMVQGDDDCYVMKLYMSGRYVIVEHRPCKYIAWCFLTCGGGELAAGRKAVTGTATTAAIQGSSLPAELCGTQVVNAPPLAGVVVPAGAAGGGGGAHRRH